MSFNLWIALQKSKCNKIASLWNLITFVWNQGFTKTEKTADRFQLTHFEMPQFLFKNSINIHQLSHQKFHGVVIYIIENLSTTLYFLPNEITKCWNNEIPTEMGTLLAPLTNEFSFHWSVAIAFIGFVNDNRNSCTQNCNCL